MNNPPDLDRFFWWGIVIFVASIIFSTALVQITTLVLTVVWLVTIAVHRPFQFKASPFDLPYLLFVVARALSVLFSVDPGESVAGLSKEVVYYGIFFVITHEFQIENRTRVRRLFLILFGCAALAAAYGSAKLLLGLTDRATSTVSGPGSLGMYLAAILGVLLLLGRNEEFIQKRSVWLVTLIIIGTGIICTLNRIHWGLMGLAVLVIGIYRERKLLLTFTLLALGTLAIPAVHQRLFEDVANLSDFLSERDIIWKGAWALAFDRPITGFGLRTFPQIFPYFDQLIDKHVGSWHNDYLQVYMESGLIGLTAFVWLGVSIFVKGWQALQSVNGFYKDLLLGLLLSMAIFFSSAFVGGFVIDPLTSLLFRFELAVLALIIDRVASVQSTVRPQE